METNNSEADFKPGQDDGTKEESYIQAITKQQHQLTSGELVIR
jgi:uncharacterized protein YheU (UPF0270 family)